MIDLIPALARRLIAEIKFELTESTSNVSGHTLDFGNGVITKLYHILDFPTELANLAKDGHLEKCLAVTFPHHSRTSLLEVRGHEIMHICKFTSSFIADNTFHAINSNLSTLGYDLLIKDAEQIFVGENRGYKVLMNLSEDVLLKYQLVADGGMPKIRKLTELPPIAISELKFIPDGYNHLFAEKRFAP